jgi:cobaltochelatase CobS
MNDLLKEIQSFATNRKIGWSDLSAELQQSMVQARPVILQLPNGKVRELKSHSPRSKHFFKVLDDILCGNNVFFYGAAGTGKTYLAEQIAKALERPFLTINCTQWTPPRELKGGETIEGYREGIAIDCWENGKILVLDELPKLDPNTAGILNEMLAKTADDTSATITTGEGRTVNKHPDFAVIATGNTTMKGFDANYSGNNQQDASLIDRFSGNYYAIDFDPQLEISLVHRPVFQIFNWLRSTWILPKYLNDIVTLRTMLGAKRTYQLEMYRETGKVPKVEGGKNLADTVLSFVNVMDEDVREDILKDKFLTNFLATYRDTKTFEQDDAELTGAVKGIVRQP